MLLSQYPHIQCAKLRSLNSNLSPEKSPRLFNDLRNMKFLLLLSMTFLLTAFETKGDIVEDAYRVWFNYLDSNGDEKVSKSETDNFDKEESPHIHTIS